MWEVKVLTWEITLSVFLLTQSFRLAFLQFPYSTWKNIQKLKYLAPLDISRSTQNISLYSTCLDLLAALRGNVQKWLRHFNGLSRQDRKGVHKKLQPLRRHLQSLCGKLQSPRGLLNSSPGKLQPLHGLPQSPCELLWLHGH